MTITIKYHIGEILYVVAFSYAHKWYVFDAGVVESIGITREKDIKYFCKNLYESADEEYCFNNKDEAKRVCDILNKIYEKENR